MEIHRVINNNIVVSEDSQGDEVILIGKGLAFGLKRGDPIQEKRVEKRFYLEDKGLYAKFKKMLQEVSLEEMHIADDIISMARRQLKREFSESIYISLPDHIHAAIKRHHDGIQLQNGLLWEIKRMYKEEFRIAEKAVAYINDQFGVDLGEDEMGFIAFHFVSAELNSEMNAITKITRCMKEIMNLVTYNLQVCIDDNSMNGFRFMTHLKFFAHRVVNKEPPEIREDTVLYDIIREKYRKAFQVALKIKDYIINQYNYEISDIEVTYLTVHLQRFLERKTE
ncbi:PRD domain-containing protein [Terribacillus sp. 7520-G]|uniref:BglG family transcription antiterminator LicT n=1 Tax=Terribacillus TaxID=459532 RepID=UPI000BA7167D|nr:PRD domain-containing protein [Terribacillus sp. 7520-G]PAD38464.1 hypothetical protein CHH53_11240 [Terribacillus sp. 7520-G]